MKTAKKIVLFIGLLGILCGIFTTPCYAEEPMQGGEYYDTKSYDVSVTIDENNQYHVKEQINVDYKMPRHGIYRYIPYKSSLIRPENGKAIWYPQRAQINIESVKGDDRAISYENGNVVVKIGNAERMVSGDKSYEIAYTYRPHDDRSSAFDEVYFNILPTQWATSIENAKFTITMPKKFDEKKVAFYAGGFGAQDQSYVKWSVNNTTITGELVKPLPVNNGVTLKIDLPQGYFTSQKTDTGITVFMWVLIIGSPLLVLLLWFLFGRDPKLIKPITVKAPDWMRPTEAGYIIDGVVETRDMISLLFYWAQKGYIHITELKTGKIELKKLKPLPEGTRTYEHTIFDRLFRLGNVVETKALEGVFYQTLALAKSQVYIQFNAKESTRLYTKGSIGAKWVAVLLSIIPFAASLFITHFINISSSGAFVLAAISTVMLLVSFIVFVQIISTWYGKPKEKRSTFLAIPLIIFAIVVVLNIFTSILKMISRPFGVHAYSGLYINPILPIICGVIASCICVAFACIMRKRTPNMNEWYGEILGLREFIEVAERDRLEMIVKESPTYFYDILPFAYVFGISEKWAAKFENIAMPAPEWYSGSTFDSRAFNTMMFMHAVNHSMNTVSNNISIPPAPTPSSGGGGFSGGGFSGGGFSGGGGGGGGGGSW
ncbi:DUF2207 domain-containing protein [Paludicola sp. MB14-C6]|uniref:DUF2207 domain-containing protein n=1 Tax=Paludihabitans sp. MB14-C6 TaxID=3070656 RepID=UPI0027DD671E|nr:DUF2207 domain-containing protein [Paludicola sp. MB14-C6]WMJ24188.1 DUF2207 domain-containing protein [Paludicola sp. MB14-C6]